MLITLNLMNFEMGWSAACFSKDGLLFFSLPDGDMDTAVYKSWNNFKKLMLFEEILETQNQVEDRNDQKSQLYKSLLQYFKDGSSDFENIKIDWSLTSEFAGKVYSTVQNIPYGEVRTYRWVAEQLNNSSAAQAVGQALKKNPFPIIIPCHRVIATNGLGGFGGGIELKKKLLEHEGLDLSDYKTG